jgi:hypothetical protein
VLEDLRAAPVPVCPVERDEGYRRLAPVVSEEEARGGGDAAPGTANRAAAEDVLGRKAGKDLPHKDLLWECGGGSGDAAATRPRRYSSWPHSLDRCSRVLEKEGCDEDRAPLRSPRDPRDPRRA